MKEKNIRIKEKFAENLAYAQYNIEKYFRHFITTCAIDSDRINFMKY